MSLVESPLKNVKTGQFVLGHTGIGGRPKGSRNMLGEAMLADLYHEWMEHGAQALREVRETKPVEFLKICALLVSKCEDAIYDRVMHDAEVEALIEERRQKVLAKMRAQDVE